MINYCIVNNLKSTYTYKYTAGGRCFFSILERMNGHYLEGITIDTSVLLKWMEDKDLKERDVNYNSFVNMYVLY